MPNINVEAIPSTEFVSPKGAFRGRYREISLALGAKKNAGPAAGGHPFDVSLEVSFTVEAGDAIVHPPGEAHQIRNTGTAELTYLIVADNPPIDPCVYPDSGKAYALLPGGSEMPIRYSTAENLDYFDGEE